MRYLIVPFILLLGALMISPAYAQECTTEWAAPVDGLWTGSGNWTNGTPAASSVACITVPGTYTVTLANETVDIAGLVIGGNSGTQTLISGTDSYVSLTLSANSRIAPNGRVVIGNGSVLGDDGLYVGGTLLVEGEIVADAPSMFLNTGGVLDVAPGGVFRYNSASGSNISGPSATFLLRGTFEGDCATTTCNINAHLESQSGTFRVLSGRFDIRGNGTFNGLELDVPEGTTLNFQAGPGDNPDYVMTGTLSGNVEGNVELLTVDMAAGSTDATLNVGGKGIIVRSLTTLMSAGGNFLNTGLVTFLHNAPRIRDVTVANEGILRVNGPNVVLEEGAIIENRANGTIDLVNDGGLSGGPDGGQVISYGPVVARLEGQPTGNVRIAVPIVFEGNTIHVTASRLHFGAGTLTDVTLDISEGSELLLTAANSDGNSGIFVVEGTLGGDIDGRVQLTVAQLQAGTEDAILNIGGEGLMLQGSGGTLASAGGNFLNTGLIAIYNNTPGIHGVTVANESMIRIDAPTVRLTESAVIENRPNGTVEFLNGGKISNIDDTSNMFINEGLVVHFSGTSDFNSTLRSQPGSEIRNLGGRVDLDPPAEHSFPQGTLLSGTNQLRFLPGLVAEGTISPGTDDEPLASLEFVTSFKLGSTARLVLDIDENGQSDLVIPAGGQANTLLGGTLVVRPRPGFTPSPGDEWTIILRSANPYNILGEFDAIEVEGDVPEGIGFITEKPNAGVVVLRAVAGMAGITSSSGSTMEGGAPVTFTVSSSIAAPPGSSLEIPLDFGGTATRFLDYVVSITGNVVRIPAGQTSTTFTLFPLSDDLEEGEESVTLSLLPGGDIVPGPDDTASVAIADGLPASALSVGGIAPDRGGMGGQVSASIYGQGFEEGTLVRLELGGTVIDGTDISLQESGYGITARFDLSGAPMGTYDVVAVSGGETSTLVGGFVVEESAGLSMWADISGTPNPRQHRWSTYTLTVGNTGNQDIHDTIVLLRITAGVEYTIEGPILIDTPELPPDPENNDYIGIDVETASVIPVYFYRIPAGGGVSVPVKIRPTGVVGSGAGVSYELYPPDPQAAFTWSGDFDDIEADIQAANYPNWPVFFGAIAWSFDYLLEQESSAARISPGQTYGDQSWGRDGDLNNEWDRPHEDLSLGELVDYYAEVTNLGDNPMDAMAVTLLAAADRGITTFFNPIGSVIGFRFALNSGNPYAIGLASVRLALALGLSAIGEEAPGRIICGFVGQECSDGGSGQILGGSAGGKVGGAVDPNDKLGPAGYSDARYTTANQPTYYTIRYENLETATFPAQEVVIVDDLDLDVYDLSTFSLGPITLPDRVLTPPPGAQSFHTTIDLSPELPALLVIHADLDQETGRVVWTFVTLDPNTNDLPEDGLIGFLPPNVNQPEGEGAVSFSIDVLPDLITNTDVSNMAEIFFDLNEPIVTPVWTNRIDRDAPSTTVVPLEPISHSPLTINVAGSDMGSGIHTYALFVAEEDGPFELYATSTEPTFVFEGELDKTYGFFSIGMDHVMNIEGPKTKAETITLIGSVSNEDGSNLPRELTLNPPYPNPSQASTTLQWGLPRTGEADIRVYDILGREVLRLVDNQLMPAGWHETTLSANLASGTYIVRLATGTETRTQRLVIVR